MPTLGYQSLIEAKSHTVITLLDITVRLDRIKFNGGKAPNKTEQIYWKNCSKDVATFT